MKKILPNIILVIVLLFKTFLCCSQDRSTKTPEELTRDLSRLFSHINPSYLSHQSFDTFYYPVYTKVVFGSNDVLSQGSSFSLVSSTYDSKFQISLSKRWSKENFEKGVYNIGFAASSSNNVFSFFAQSQWQQGITITLGTTHHSNKRVGVSPPYDLTDLRQKFAEYRAAIIVQNYNALTKASHLKDQIKKMQFTDADLQKARDLEKFFANSIGSKIELDATYKIISTEEYLKKILKDSILSVNYIDSCVTAFQIAYFKKPELKFSWHSYQLKPQYAATSIYDTTAARLIGIQKKNYLNIAAEYNWYHINIKSNSTFFWQFGLGLTSTNYLNGKKSNQVQSLITQINSSLEINSNKEAVVVSNYDQYKRRFILIYPSIGFDYFIGKNRSFGFESFFSSNIGLKPQHNPYQSTFACRAGFLFSLRGGTDLAKSTFGIFAQFQDVTWVKPTTDQTFSVALRIGIPFNL